MWNLYWRGQTHGLLDKVSGLWQLLDPPMISNMDNVFFSLLPTCFPIRLSVTLSASLSTRHKQAVNMWVFFVMRSVSLLGADTIHTGSLHCPCGHVTMKDNERRSPDRWHQYYVPTGCLTKSLNTSSEVPWWDQSYMAWCTVTPIHN
jgi:hypothetical protein